MRSRAKQPFYPYIHFKFVLKFEKIHLIKCIIKKVIQECITLMRCTFMFIDNMYYK